MAFSQRTVSMGKRLRHCKTIACLGVLPNWKDYPPSARALIRNAERVCYPSRLYEDILRLVGKRVFPSSYYSFMGNKIRQTALFELLGISHPRTRIYYGRDRAARILEDFKLPVVAKTPLGSSQGRGVWLILGREPLHRYLDGHHPAYIQELLPVDRDLRIVLVGGRVIHAYWRIAESGEFRNNVSQGARISFADIPEEGLRFAEDTAGRCRFEEVGLDICYCNERYYVLEANMVFGLEGFRRRGMDLLRILADLGDSERLWSARSE
jgi:ribosomal protein S6--L-glutamate ligase